jgi:hypothetical protein
MVSLQICTAAHVQEAHGFTLMRNDFIVEYGSRVAIFRHNATGAECMSVSNSDENKTFGVVFRTPVEDSTGIPHILEHSVLNGSRKFPVKEPFVELIKGSLHTFINAFTYPDRTCYPVASTNLQVRRTLQQPQRSLPAIRSMCGITAHDVVSQTKRTDDMHTRLQVRPRLAACCAAVQRLKAVSCCSHAPACQMKV